MVDILYAQKSIAFKTIILKETVIWPHCVHKNNLIKKVANQRVRKCQNAQCSCKFN